MKRLMSIVMPSCREVTTFLASEVESSWWRRATVWMHLSMCEHCSRFARQLRFISQALRTAWSPASFAVAESLKRRIIDRLRSS